MTEIPEWLEKAIQRYRPLFGVGTPDYQIEATITDKPGDDPECRAITNCNTPYKSYFMEFARNLTGTDRDKITVMHELIHIAMSELDHTAFKCIDQIPDNRRQFFVELYKDARESFVQKMARNIFYNLKDL